MHTDNAMRNLLRLMSVPADRVAEVTKTSDGFYMARARGDSGFNLFLGRPAPPHDGPGRNTMLRHWVAMTEPERRLVVALAQAKGIDLAADFGVPVRGKV